MGDAKVMGWSLTQQQRLLTEKNILKKYFPAFEWKNATDPSSTKVEGYVKSNSGNLYKLRVYVPADFPNSRPSMVVIAPSPLRGYGSKNFVEYGVSGVMHTLAPIDGYATICHYKNWLPNLTIYLVVLKGRIWIEAFEGHKRTGHDLDHFLKHMV